MKYEHILTKEILENSYQELQSLKAVGRKFSDRKYEKIQHKTTNKYIYIHHL